MDCPPPGARALPHGPATWEAGGRAIDAFCTTVLRAGFAATLFVTPEAADAHAPLLEEYAGSGVDVGLLLQPPTLRGAGYKRYLGAYPGELQQQVVQDAVRRFEDALERRPLSVRSAMFSASDETFPQLATARFRQSSISSPGRRTPKYQAVWAGAAADTHFASATDRLQAGALPLVEVPATTDATQCRGGLSPDLAVENGTLDRWHAPLIASQLERHEREQIAFRTLCFVTTSRFPYQDRSSRPRYTLESLLSYLVGIDERYDVVPSTLAEAYAHFRSAT
ncbi:MAG: hypothetical protein HY332_17530 [Chloroflexi bacterium]|nr:hypothetical protein [Chloroflexota bacterium]